MIMNGVLAMSRPEIFRPVWCGTQVLAVADRVLELDVLLVPSMCMPLMALLADSVAIGYALVTGQLLARTTEPALHETAPIESTHEALGLSTQDRKREPFGLLPGGLAFWVASQLF